MLRDVFVLSTACVRRVCWRLTHARTRGAVDGDVADEPVEKSAPLGLAASRLTRHTAVRVLVVSSLEPTFCAYAESCEKLAGARARRCVCVV